jgi:3-methyladenine DNA glycosylase AlkC
MTAAPKPQKKAAGGYVPYSEWSSDVITRIKSLSDECLDRFKDDKKVNSEMLKVLSKLQTLVEKKYNET